jgi:phage terminase large subunit
LGYALDPVAFCRERLGVELWPVQERILRALVESPQVTVRSAHGVGKTFVAACATLWWVCCHSPSLVLTTAPTQRQVESLLWGEINRLWRRTAQPLPGSCLLTKLAVSPDQQALGLTTNEPDKFAGWHREHLMAIVDEASGVPDPIYEVLQGTLTSAHCRLLLIGNPVRPSGRFYQSHLSDDWERLKISAYDTPNFRQPGAVPCPWLVTPSWVEARRREWGEESTAFRIRVLAEFPTGGPDTLIPLSWIEAAEESDRVVLSEGERVLALDVARYGDCESVAAIRSGDLLEEVVAWQGMDLMQSCGRLLRLVDQWRPQTLVIDGVGLGAGVVDRLRELSRETPAPPGLAGLIIVSFQSGERAHNPQKFRNRRDEAYWRLRERYEAGEIAHRERWGKLLGQLSELRYGFTSRNQTQIETKDELRRRGVPSPDWADAVALAFAPARRLPARPVMIGVNRVVPKG